jgi:Tfp pilus assembly protein PilW
MKTRASAAAFTLAELLIGMALALTVMFAMLSTVTFMGRNLNRLVNQQTLESQGRLVLQYLTQDLRKASAVTEVVSSGTLGSPPKIRRFSLMVVDGPSTTIEVEYAYTSATQTLTRTPDGGATLTLAANLLDLDIGFYTSTNVAVTDFTNKRDSIKQASLTFSAQTGRAATGTLAPVHWVTSPYLSLGNKPRLP